jgi:hypothetical protein
MEFSSLGKHCSYDICNQQDYLPFKCTGCSNFYCLDHKEFDKHQCINKPKDKVLSDEDIKKRKVKFPYKCSVCPKRDVQEFMCDRCKRNMCIKHRLWFDHDCTKGGNKGEDKRKKKEEDKEGCDIDTKQSSCRGYVKKVEDTIRRCCKVI